MAACVECLTPMSGIQCSKCGAWALTPAAGGLGRSIGESDLVDATQVSATAIERVVTGTPLDAAWGGGFTRKTTSVLTGLPGSGKSTACLQLTPIFARLTGRPGFYVSGENEAEELAFTLNRLKIKLEPGQLRLVRSMKSSGLIDEAVLAKCPPGLIIVDSLSTLAGAKDYSAQAQLCRAYKTIATKFDCVVLMVSQQNKQGTTLGLQALQHDCDTVIDVDTMEKDYRRRARVLRDHCIDGDPDLRAFVAYKNRYGATFQYHYVIMGPNGLEPLPPPPKGMARVATGDRLADAVLDLDGLDEEEEALRARLQEIKGERAEKRMRVATIAAAKQRAAVTLKPKGKRKAS